MTFSEDLGARQCRKCGIPKPRSEFSTRNKTGRKPAPYSWCRTCENESARERHRLVFDAVTAIKLERGCIDCGYRTDPAALEFDHLPGCEKLFSISQGCTTRSLEKVLAEIEKCEVVCANCHAIRTVTRSPWARPGRRRHALL